MSGLIQMNSNHKNLAHIVRVCVIKYHIKILCMYIMYYAVLVVVVFVGVVVAVPVVLCLSFIALVRSDSRCVLSQVGVPSVGAFRGW